MSRMELSIATAAPPAPPAVVPAAEAPRKGPAFDLGTEAAETSDPIPVEGAAIAPAAMSPMGPAAPVMSVPLGTIALAAPSVAAEDGAVAAGRDPSAEPGVVSSLHVDKAQPDGTVAASPSAGAAPIPALGGATAEAKVAADAAPARAGASSPPAPSAERPPAPEGAAAPTSPRLAEVPAGANADAVAADPKAPLPPAGRGATPESRRAEAPSPTDPDATPALRALPGASSAPSSSGSAAAVQAAPPTATWIDPLGAATTEAPPPVSEVEAEARPSDVENTTLAAHGISGSSGGARADGPSASASASAGATATPQAVTRQIVDSVVRQGADGVEIRLDPPELGKVRMSLAPGDGAMTAVITAERPETLDLLRRHADMLARDLAASGQGRVDLRFGADGQGSGGDPRDRPSGPYRTDPEPATTSAGRAWTGGGAGLDLRV